MPLAFDSAALRKWRRGGVIAAATAALAVLPVEASHAGFLDWLRGKTEQKPAAKRNVTVKTPEPPVYTVETLTGGKVVVSKFPGTQ